MLLGAAFALGTATGAGVVKLLHDRSSASRKRAASSRHAVKAGTPHPDWHPGMRQAPPYEVETISLDPAQMDAGSRYQLGISAVVPRPIGVLTAALVPGKAV